MAKSTVKVSFSPHSIGEHWDREVTSESPDEILVSQYLLCILQILGKKGEMENLQKIIQSDQKFGSIRGVNRNVLEIGAETLEYKTSTTFLDHLRSNQNKVAEKIRSRLSDALADVI